LFCLTLVKQKPLLNLQRS